MLRELLLALAACALIAGCTPDAGSKPGASKGKRGPPPHLVELAPAQRRPLVLSEVHIGSLRARRLARLHIQEAGRITTLPFFEGDAVAEGAVLAEIDRSLLDTELLRAGAVRREAQANLGRLERLSRSKMVSEDEVLRARTAVDVALADETLLRTRLGYTRITAPFDGVVSERLAEPGDVAERYDHVMTLIDPSSLVAELPVSELLLPHIGAGAQAEVRIDALGDGAFPGRILRVHPGLDPSTRQGRVEVELRPTPEGARPGQLARVTFAPPALERLVVPFSAIRRDQDGEHVFVVQTDGKVRKAPVRGGRRVADRIEVLDGLRDGERVVVRGFLGLKPGITVTPVEGGG
jgi:membrane fusion protein (multidrug efflux system)